jgi:DNA (cytosine-5)-methyltransferase 1
MKKKYTVGSLYAGVGGICLGFKKAGFVIDWANEYDKNACITYRENFKHTLIEGDIMDIDIKALNKIDILAGGFPCQPFSVAGYRKGFDDNRGNHFFRMLDFVDEMRPKVLFFENVKNLVGHDKGNTFKVIRKEIEKRNYSFASKVLNTKDYGNIPHNRERIFIVAFDPNQVDNFSEFKFPEKIELTKNIHDILEKGKQEEKYYYKKDHQYYPKLDEEMISKDTVYQWRRVYVRENKSNVCPTLTANMGTGGHNVPLIRDNFGIRKLTPRECFSFQGYPNNYILPNLANGRLYKQAGNSVTITLIERIAKQIKEVL